MTSYERLSLECQLFALGFLGTMLEVFVRANPRMSIPDEEFDKITEGVVKLAERARMAMEDTQSEYSS